MAELNKVGSWFLVLQGQLELNFIHNEGGLSHIQTNILSSKLANVQSFKFGHQHAHGVDRWTMSKHGNLVLDNGVVEFAASVVAIFTDHQLKMVCA